MKNKSSLSLNKNSVTNKINIGQCIKVANISLYVLAAICFMVYATQNYTHAEGDDEDLGYDITSANASVTVGTACTFTATVDSEHNATIANGIYSTDIGKTTLNTICNDSGGYAVYAIGYTGDEYGATDLTSDISSTYNISTGTNTSGDSSSWAMKLAQEPGTTTATIENGYNNYNIVPDDYTKVATLNTITDNTSTSSATGSSISTTYQTYISPTQPAGTYTGKVKYTLVHPSTAPKPEKPVFMHDTAKIKSKLTNTGDTTQVVDSRDNKKYLITKLADGNIWMTQNLDLDLDSTRVYTPADTDVSTNWQPIRSTIEFTGTSASGWASDYYTPYSASPGDLYIYTSGADTTDSQYASLTACQAEHPDCSPHNHIGNYYNWSAAAASNNTSGMATNYSNAPDSICPAGWRLPKITGSDWTTAGSEFGSMLVAENIISSPINNWQNYATDGFKKIRTSPLWLVRTGSISGNGSLSTPGNEGDYWSSTVYFNDNAYQLVFYSSSLSPAGSNNKTGGHPVRCLMR